MNGRGAGGGVAAAPIGSVLEQHVEEAAQLRRARTRLVRSAHLRLDRLERLDERLAAHLDGIAVAGDHGARLAALALERAGAGEVFVAAVGAIARGDAGLLDRLVAIAEVEPDAARGLLSAFGWSSARDLRGTVARFALGRRPLHRLVALSACAMHGVDPGAVLAGALGAAEVEVRRRACRTAGRVGRRDLLGACVDAFDDPGCRFEAARAAWLLGERRRAVDVLEALATDAAADAADAALELLLLVLPPARTRPLLAAVGADPGRERAWLHGLGIAGDAAAMPALLAAMASPATARCAGEAAATLAGIDLAETGLDRAAPAGRAPSPNDDPDDADVAPDVDADLPWPDPERFAAWWHARPDRPEAGRRSFIGGAPGIESCRAVLAGGPQRRRTFAALQLASLAPATGLFDTFAPVHRQRRWLRQTTAAGRAGHAGPAPPDVPR